MTPDIPPSSRTPPGAGGAARRPDPFLAADASARAEAGALIRAARHAVLGCIDPVSGAPHLSRIALQADADGAPLALLSGLALHTRALLADPRAGLLIAPEAPGRGDAMAQARLSLQVRAGRAPPDAGRRDRWLAADPRARVYADLPDFAFWRLEPVSGLLNAGFGRAIRLGRDDLPPRAMPDAPA